jgi:hypothetical protein
VGEGEHKRGKKISLTKQYVDAIKELSVFCFSIKNSKHKTQLLKCFHLCIKIHKNICLIRHVLLVDGVRFLEAK